MESNSSSSLISKSIASPNTNACAGIKCSASFRAAPTLCINTLVNQKWQLQPRPSVTKQLNVIKRFLHEASEIVHAGDPDREGQLLVDEVLDYLQLAPEKRQQVQRCLINDLNPQAVERAIDRLRSNSEFVPLCVSALARARADWLYGINMTRAYTILGRNAGYQGVLSAPECQFVGVRK